MHAWRKIAKDLRYVAETLERAGARRGKAERRLRRVARRADRLGEMLGEEHDLALLEQRVRAHSQRRELGKRAHRDLLKAVERRRKRLRKRALRAGERLYERKPSRFVRRVRGAL
jgi:CHAD domain-containing protein